MSDIVALKDLCEIDITDGTHKTPTYSNEGFIFLSSKNVTSGKIDWEDIMYIPQWLHDELYKRIAPKKDDILLAKNGTTGVAAIVDKDEIFDIYVSLALIRPDKRKILPRYLLHAINSEPSKKFFDSHLKGIGVPNLHLTHIRETPINVPSFAQQQYIIDILDKLESNISLRKQQLSKLDELVKSRFIEMFGDQRTNPFGWDMVTIGDIATEVRYGTSRPAVEGGKYPYLRMNNLTYEGYLDLTDLKYIDIPDNEIEKCVVRNGDVLFNRTNSVELVGKTCVYNLDYDMVIAGYIIRVRIDDRMLPVVLSNYLNSTVLKEQLRSMAKGAVNQANINAQELRSIPIYLPPIDLQHEFVAFVEQIDKSKFEIQKSLEKLETLKKALMQKYFG